MRSDVSNDVEWTLPRRDLGQAKCPTPDCPRTVRIRGEHCAVCRRLQEAERDAIRARREAVNG